MILKRQAWQVAEANMPAAPAHRFWLQQQSPESRTTEISAQQHSDAVVIVCLQLQTADNTGTRGSISMYLGGFSTPTRAHGGVGVGGGWKHGLQDWPVICSNLLLKEMATISPSLPPKQTYCCRSSGRAKACFHLKAWLEHVACSMHVAVSSFTRPSGWRGDNTRGIMPGEIEVDWFLFFFGRNGKLWQPCLKASELSVNNDSHQTRERGLFPNWFWLRGWKRYINHQSAAPDTHILRAPHSHMHTHAYSMSWEATGNINKPTTPHCIDQFKSLYMHQLELKTTSAWLFGHWTRVHQRHNPEQHVSHDDKWSPFRTQLGNQFVRHDTIN